MRPLPLVIISSTTTALTGASGSGLRECSKVVDLRPDGGEWLIVGCIYKDQPLKPSILDEFRYARGDVCLSALFR